MAAAVAATAVWAAGVSRAADFAVGQKVEVREGDSWSAATVLKQEGRKFQVHYAAADAAADEWVTTDRMRAPGTAASPATAPAAKLKFAAKDRVEVKEATTWKKAVVVNARDGWYLIQFDGWTGDLGKEWAEPDRVRKAGSTEDTHAGWGDAHPYHRGEGPPTGKAADARPGPGLPGGSPKVPPADFPLVDADVSGMATVDVGSAAVEWSFKPTSPPAPPREPSAKTVVLRGGTHGVFEQATALTVSSYATPVAAVFYEDSPPGETVACHVERIDLLTGEDKGVAAIPPGAVPLSVGPDGTQVLCRSEFGGGWNGQRQLHLFAVDKAGPPRHVLSWVPYAGRDGPDAAVARADFVDAAHVLTVGGGDQGVLWELPPGGRPPRAVYSIKPAFGSLLRLSPDKRVLVTSSTTGLHLFDPLTGGAVGTIPGRGYWTDVVAVAPGGGQVAVLDSGSAHVYDGRTGLPTRSIATAGFNFHPTADFTPGDMLLVNGSRLYDPARRLGVWTYSPPAGDVRTCYFGGRLYYMPTAAAVGPADAKGKSSWLASAVVPHQQATDAAAAAARDADLFVVHPGITVSLDLAGVQGTDDDRGHVRDGLTRVFAANQFTVADTAPIRVVATFAPAADKSVTYHFTDKRPDETVSVKQFAYKLSMVDAATDAAVWTRGAENGVPSAVLLKPGESAAAVVEAMNKPDLDYFETAGLPDYVQRGGEAATLGRTPLTVNGLPKDAKTVQPPAGAAGPPTHRVRRP